MQNDVFCLVGLDRERVFFPTCRGRAGWQSRLTMKRPLSVFLALLAIGAGVFAYMQHSAVADLRRQLATITAERDAALADTARAKAGVELATENITRLTAERDAAVERAKKSGSPPPFPVATNPAKSADESGGKSMMQGIAKMFETEDGKKMMRAQMAMGIKMQFGGLAKDLKLDPTVADQVMALVADRQAAMSEMAFALMKDGALDEGGAKAMGAKGEALKKEYDEKLRAVLGEDGMKQLTEYERTLGDRMMLSMHEQQFTSAGAPLEQTQRDALLQIMKEERLKTPASVFDSNNQSDPSKAFSKLKDDAAVEKWIAQEEEYQRRVLQAAPGMLNPDQVNALQQSFKQQLEMQRFGVKMSKEMFKGGSGAPNVNASPAAVPALPVK